MSDIPTEFINVAPVSELPADGLHRFRHEEHDVLVCAMAGAFYAVENRCSHQARPLHMGRLRGGALYCPVHGAKFDPVTGAAGSPPATTALVTFETRVVDGVLQVALPA